MFDSEEREQNTHKIAPVLFDFFIYFHSRVVKRHTADKKLDLGHAHQYNNLVLICVWVCALNITA